MLHEIKKLTNNQKGTAMALALLISAILLGLGLALVFMATMEQMTSNYVVKGSQAFYGADVEAAYLSVGRRVIGSFNEWDDVLFDTNNPPAQFCQIGTPVAGNCADQIPLTYQDLRGPWCPGRILRIPPASTWDLLDPTANPFRLQCALTDTFCNCQLVFSNGSALPARTTFYARNDLNDGTITQDNNGEIQLIAISEIASGITTKSVIAYDLSAWMQEGLIYDIHQTSSVQKLTSQ